MADPNNNPPASSAGSRTLAGIRVSAVFEIVVFLAVALAMDQILFDGSRFRSAAQHPFWILVLLISVQYGTNSGLLAALASSAAFLIGNVPPQTISEDRFEWLFDVGRLPLLWFLAAVVLGELRMRQLRERRALTGQLAETRHREQVLAEAYGRLTTVKDALETRVAGQLRTAVGIYESARSIEKLDPADVLLGVANLIRSIMNPETFSVYLLQNGSLELAVEEGWAPEDRFSRRYAVSDPLFQEIIGHQRVLSVANPEDVVTLSNSGMIAAPLVVPDTGRVIGMLKIERLGFLDLNFSNVQTLKVLCQWIGAAYENAERFQAARGERVVNAETDLLAYSFLSRQLSFLTSLARRVGFDLTMIVVRLENPGDLTGEQRIAALHGFRDAVSRALRKTDLAFDYQRTGTEFALVLPAAPVKDANIVIGKLRAEIEAEVAPEAPQARFSYAVHAVHDMMPVEEQRPELQNV
jgi:hypothetical protein